MSYSDDAALTIMIEAKDLSSQTVDQAVSNLEGLATAGETAGTAIGDIGPTFADASDSIDTAAAQGELIDLATGADDAGEAAQNMGQDFQDAGDNLNELDLSGAFSRENRQALKGATEILDNLAGTNLSPLVGGLLEVSKIAKPFQDTIESSLGGVMGKLGAKLAPLGAAAGAAIGEAQAVAQSAAATGQAAIGRMVAGLAATQIPLAAEGTTVGTVVGGAMASGVVAGLSGAALGAGIAVAFDQASIQADAKVQAMSEEQARIYSGSFADTIFTTLNQVLPQGFLGPGYTSMLNDLAAKSAEGAGAAAGTSFADTYSVHAQTAMSDFISTERTENNAAAMGTSAGKAFTGDLATSLQNNTDVISTAMDKVQWAIEHPMELLAQEAKLQGAIQQLEYSSGMAGNSDEVNRVIDEQLAALKAQWLLISGKAYDGGYNAQAAYARGVSQGPRVRIGANVTGALTDLDPGHHYSGGGRAGGGPASAGIPIKVGEWRAEWFIPGEPGYISSSLPRGNGSPINLNVNFSSLTPPTASQGQEIAQALVPELVREMRRQGIRL